MPDSTLVSEELKEKSSTGMIENFSEENLSGASYDFRAGKKVKRAGPRKNKTEDGKNYETLSLEEDGSIDLKPGYAYTIYSKERINLPPEIQGRLSIKFKLAAKKLFYSGGIIDPGYEGRLYFTIFNLSSSAYTINYEEPLVKGEFKQIDAVDSEDTLHEGEEELDIEEMLPDNPSRSKEIRDWETINEELDRLSDVPNEVNNLKNKYDSIDKQLNNLFYAAIGSIIGGVFAGAMIKAIEFIF